MKRTLALLLLASFAFCQSKPRARDLGVPFVGLPGPLNAITDVKGVEVGETTLVGGAGKSAIRTGVTAVLPRGKASEDPVYAGWFSLNGAGELTGTTWVEESGFLEGPVMITNTHSVGVVHDAVIAWRVQHGYSTAYPWSSAVVGETDDSWLNDMNGFHVKAEDAFHAIDASAPGPVAEGNVGGGTGTVCNEFKGGTGTASRVVEEKFGTYTVGVLVQCNFGLRQNLLIAGVPVGREISDHLVYSRERGSIIVVVATDAPLLPHQLKAVARRVSLGMARVGSYSGDGSGDIFIAFSTANPRVYAQPTPVTASVWPNERLDEVFAATAQATEEAIVNSMVAAETMTGFDGHTVIALPHDRLREVLKKYNRLVK